MDGGDLWSLFHAVAAYEPVGAIIRCPHFERRDERAGLQVVMGQNRVSENHALPIDGRLDSEGRVHEFSAPFQRFRIDAGFVGSLRPFRPIIL